ncbi:TetR/AcrR family transcriptional regulator [Massilia sp. G4R7]|uniref:TetR/AcrR family transcriptional regulator n=1 Tax=Massilia phyllostachyos TaxID=2898585 RepID=A0ABS8QCT4_9BURK|nr:TetR/AcrR family transcriptional regulator [Massilia phyllostachyos]MCD2519568.1 TetR/AcrR family transcriptional regulator [Massilia phyllostachyos]
MNSVKSSKREQSHHRIVEAASRAVRRHGYAGVGVAEVMKEAGLTHGGFYAHFDSREALLVEAIEHAGAISSATLDERIAARTRETGKPLQALIELYLSDEHLAHAEHGCVVGALASEIPRQHDVVREASVQRVDRLVRRVALALPDDAAPELAGVIAGALVGNLQLARIQGDNAEGRAVLAAARKTLAAAFSNNF